MDVTHFNRNPPFSKIQVLNVLFINEVLLLRYKLAEEEGIQPPVALSDSRQFSGLVTLATRPLLRI